MSKAIICLLVVTIFYQSIFSQKLWIGNDSLSFSVKPTKDHKGNISGFAFELTNNSVQKVYVGATPKNEVSCYVSKVGNTLLILCGGIVPGMYDYTPQSMRLSILKKSDTLKFGREIYQQYKGIIKLSKLEYEKSRKVFVIDYIISREDFMLNTEDYKYSDFVGNKNRLSLEVNPN